MRKFFLMNKMFSLFVRSSLMSSARKSSKDHRVSVPKEKVSDILDSLYRHHVLRLVKWFYSPVENVGRILLCSKTFVRNHKNLITSFNRRPS